MNHLNNQSSLDWLSAMGDMTLGGWFITAAYFTVAFICLWTAHGSRHIERDKKAYLYWLLLAVFVGTLGLNKQLDIQTLIVIAGRNLARLQGWYEYRRTFQAAFAMTVIAVALSALLAILWINRRRLRQRALDLCGLGLLIVYALLRVAQFEHLDRFVPMLLSKPIWLELLGILCVAIAAWREGRRINSTRGEIP